MALQNRQAVGERRERLPRRLDARQLHRSRLRGEVDHGAVLGFDTVWVENMQIRERQHGLLGLHTGASGPWRELVERGMTLWRSGRQVHGVGAALAKGHDRVQLRKVKPGPER